MKSLGSRLQTLWCRTMHPAPMWPVHGRYQCPVCLRSYPVRWEQIDPPQAVSALELPAEDEALRTRRAAAAIAATSR